MKKNSWVFENVPEYAGESISERISKKGTNCLSNKELISLAISASTNKLDDKKLDKVLELVESKSYSYDSLKAIIGEEKTLSLLAVLELSNRFNSFSNNFSIQSPQDIFNAIRHYAFNNNQENFIVIVLNGAHNILDTFVATTGLVNRSLVHPREVFSRAIELKATDIIIAHNHPSGILSPSKEDIATTTRLAESGELLGIRVLDHLIFSNKSYFSFKEHGLF